jgi:hypothetical protein
MIACLSDAGESLLPYIVTSQNSSTVQKHLKTHGVHFGKDFTLEFNQKPYVNVGIFPNYIRTIFLPYIDTLRSLTVFSEEVVVILMDNCSAHASDDVIGIVTEASVHVITFAPRTTQVFQILDLTVFLVLTRRPRYELPVDDDDAILKSIMKVYHDFMQTMAQPNVWGTFHALALEFDTRKDPYRLLFHEEKLRGNAGFQELCSVDCPVDQLSDRRRRARFGWINKHE